MPPVDILYYVFVVTGIFLLIIGVFIATILLNQRRFIGVQKEKLAESKKLEDALRLIPQKMVEAQEEERKRVSKELHDGINQMLAATKYRIHALRSLTPPDAQGIGRSADAISADLDKTIDEVKRISHALHPKVLDDLGFLSAVRNLLEECRLRSGLRIEENFDDLPAHLPHDIELGVFRIIQESLHNIEKHAAARSVSVEVRRIASSLCLSIKDDGAGFDPADADRSGNRRSGLGLTTMRERAILMSAVLEIQSVPGKGTTITLTIPSKSE